MEPPKEKIFDYIVMFVLFLFFIAGFGVGFITKWLI